MKKSTKRILYKIHLHLHTHLDAIQITIKYTHLNKKQPTKQTKGICKLHIPTYSKYAQISEYNTNNRLAGGN